MKTIMFRRILYILLTFSFSLHLTAQNTQVEFGKNRVQYKRLSWQFLKGDRYNTYFYLGGQELGRFIHLNAEKHMKEVEDFFQYQIYQKVDIIVFTDLNDIYQTNIGYTTGVASNDYLSPNSTKIVQGKMFLYFNGNHSDLIKQIKKGFATIVLERMLNDRSFTERMQSNANLYFPEWFTNGLIHYYINGFKENDLDEIRTILERKRYKKFLRITNLDPILAGSSFWYFIEKNYGSKTLSSLLYMARIQRNLEYAFNYSLGKTSTQLYKDYHKFFVKAYQEAKDRTLAINADTTFKKRLNKRFQYYNIQLSDDGQKIAYVRNFMGRYNVRVFDQQTGRTKTILRGSYRSNEKIIDKSFPLLDWVPNANKLTIMFEKKDEIYFKHYDLDNKEKELMKLLKVQKIHDFSYGNNDQFIYMSASAKGQSDLYRMHLATQRMNPLTQDIYDDLAPKFIKTNTLEGLLFISNRPYNEQENYSWQDQNICFYNFKDKKNRIVKLTNDGTGQYTDFHTFKNEIRFYNNHSGIKNLYKGHIDTEFVKFDTIFYFSDSMLINPKKHFYYFNNQDESQVEEVEFIEIKRPFLKYSSISNFNQSILSQDDNKDEYAFFTSGKRFIKMNISKKHKSIDYKVEDYLQIDGYNDLKDNFKPINEDTTSYFIIQPYLFSKEDLLEEKESNIKPKKSSKNNLRNGFKRSDIIIYRPTMKLEYANFNLDNATILTPYTLQGSNTTLSPMLKASATDIFEDYRFIAGAKIPFNLSDKEYFISYDNNKKRLDKRLLFYRRNSIVENPIATANMMSNYIADQVTTKLLTNLAEIRLNWPFSEISAIRMSTTAKQEIGVTRAVELNSLLTARFNEYRAFGRIEYVYDNSIVLLQNIRLGIRFKTFYEYQKLLNAQKSYTNVVGTDFRIHNRLHRLITLNNRIAFGQSFGTNNVAFTLGGIDGWLQPNRDEGVQRSQNYNFQQEAYVTNLRGYNQNIRNGNKYAVLNSEIRVPVIRYFNIPWYKEFWQKLQIIGFGDVATAWVGPSPFSDENPYGNETLGGPPSPVKVIVNYEVDPILRSLGWGIRSKVFGYYIRAERAYPYHNGQFRNPVWQLSTVLDF